MLLMKRSMVLAAGFVLLTTGCNIQPGSRADSTLTIAPPLNPYQSTTKTPAPLTPTSAFSTVEPNLPTPTPFKHAIEPGETLYGIAIKYNVSFDRLVSANPGLDPRLLTVGTEVIIPLTDEESPPTPTPYPIISEKPACYPTTDGNLYCYALVENDQNISLENISLAFNIFNEDQELVRSQIGFSPLNTLFPGQKIPIGALIPDTAADQDLITTTLLTAYPSNLQNPLVLISDHSLEYFQENTNAHVMGTYEILVEDVEGRQVWVVGVGYHQGKPVAVRKWISTIDIEQGSPYPFDFYLYSLGPEIDSVQLFSELH